MKRDGNLERTIRLVAAVEKHPELYDFTKEQYQSKYQTDRAWARISRQMDEPADECKQKWKNIRNSYSRHLRQKADGSRVRRPYYLEEHVKFIANFLTFKTPLPAKNSFHDELHIDDTDDNTALDMKLEEYQEVDDSDDDAEAESETEETNASTAKKSRVSNFNFVNADADAELNQGAPDDPDLAFLRSVLPDMKLMDQNMKRKFKIEVLRLCSEMLGQDSQ